MVSHKKLSCTNNRKVSAQLSKPFQSGGTATIATNVTTGRATSSGVDLRGLGRWSWLHLTGKNRLTTQIVTAYCPIKISNPTGCYMQQIQGLLTQIIRSCPRRQFWTGLKAFAEEVQAQGEQLIMMGDWNSRMGNVNNFFENLKITEAIQEQQTASSPVTCNCSHLEPLDNIYTSSTLVGIHGSYLSFRKLGGDHRGLIFDILDEFIFGFNLVPPCTWWFKLNTPAIA